MRILAIPSHSAPQDLSAKTRAKYVSKGRARLAQKLKKERHAKGSTDSLRSLTPIVQMVLHADQLMDLVSQVWATCASMRRKAKNVKASMNLPVTPSQSAKQDLNAETLTK